MTSFFTDSSATLSLCGRYRYSLSRVWNKSQSTVCWIMLNPSKADAEVDDPTIRRCVSFGKLWGYGGIRVVNLFAYRATNPKDVDKFSAVSEPGDPSRNDRFILDAIRRSPAISVAAWGNNANTIQQSRVCEVLRMVKAEKLTLMCFGLTSKRQPRHPLYQPRGRKLITYV